MNRMKSAAAIFAMVAMASSQMAAAQKAAPSPCITEAEVTDLVIYLAPQALGASNTKCRNSLEKNGFLASGGKVMTARYQALSDATWPRAKRAFQIFMSKNGDALDEIGGAQILNVIPDDVLRPFLDAMFVQKIAQEIKLEDCRKIERVAEALAPMEPAELGNLAAVIVSLANVKNPEICPVDAS